MPIIFNITAAPVIIALPGLPGITGTAQVGQILTASTGTWANVPTSVAYQWNSSAGGAISGATASTYVPVTGDIGNTLTVSVVATNSIGPSSPAQSAATPAVIAAAGPALITNLSMATGTLPLGA